MILRIRIQINKYSLYRIELIEVFRTAFVDIDLCKQFPTSNSFGRINSILKNKVVLQFKNVK